AYWWMQKAHAAPAVVYKTPEEKNDVYVRFDMEAYDIIAAHYWQQTTDAQLSQLFQLSLEKAASTSSEPLATQDRAGVATMLEQAFAATPAASGKKQLALQVLNVALYNLSPTGRSGVLSSQAQTALQNTVSNIQPSNNPYTDLGVSQNATPAEIKQAYQQKAAALAATTTAAGKAAQTQLAHAYQTLTNPVNKQIYDTSQSQPTVFSHILNPQTLYIDISQVAPTTIQEISAALSAASSTPTFSNLILDMRGNIGGDLTFAQEFLSLFYGPNQYAFDLFHQGNLEVQRTGGVDQSPEATHFKEIAVIDDHMTQSTAELVASILKHDHLAYTVGETSRGWGSVEQVLPMQTVIDPSETYALELVVYLTVRYDGLPIEGNGVVPDIDTTKPGWRSALPNFFTSGAMQEALSRAAGGAPMQ
ncbi:MAG TPA: S41 family peptidase, partial [Candidatus Paceibacterota bacterium]|nr:S41 family peptidase [Candidatus Paceibacterota bacterium]